MIGNQKTKDDGYVNVSCKVPVWVADLLNIIAKARGAKTYEIIQLCVNFIIETAKVSGPVPPQMQALLNMMKMDADWNKSFSFSSPSAQTDIAQAILILQQRDDKQPRKGFGMVMIDKPFLPGYTPSMTTNVDKILERVAEVGMNNLYIDLRQVGIALDSQSVRETLTLLCDAALIEHMNQMDVAEFPRVGNFSDFGKAIEYGQRTKQKKHLTPDHIQTHIVFTDYDRETTDCYASDGEREHRQE